jgi:uncharacterized protein DUF1877
MLNVLYPEEEDDRCLDIDKSWHAIHFLLSGDAWDGEYPLSDVILGGSEMSDEDLGFGPARYLNPQEVQEMADALASVSEERLLRNFSPEAFAAAHIYPEGWLGTDEERQYIVTNFRKLKEFVTSAARADDAVVLWLA